MDPTRVGDPVAAGDRGPERVTEDMGGEDRAVPAGRPEHEPAAATMREDRPDAPPRAPDDPAPDMADINPGEGPGRSPGE